MSSTHPYPCSAAARYTVFRIFPDLCLLTQTPCGFCTHASMPEGRLAMPDYIGAAFTQSKVFSIKCMPLCRAGSSF